MTGDIEMIPPIIDLDAHVVEPADVWSNRLPAKFSEVGPRIEMRPAGEITLTDAGYREAPGTDGPNEVAWWHYEDQLASIKRPIAAAGYPTDEITMTGINYDLMRPGCYQPSARLDDMSISGVEAQLVFESAWDPRSLLTLETRMDSWQPVVRGGARRSIRSSCVSGRCGWCWTFVAKRVGTSRG